jgi:sugar-specific transcriptional regulator TrmB
MDKYEKLIQVGLTGNEAKVYLELVEKGSLSANQIAKNISMDRTLTYTVLNNLIDKGNVHYIIKEGKKLFSSSDTQSLLNPIKSKEAIVLDLIKELNTIKKKEQQEIEVNFYEGKEGIRTFVREFIGSGKHFDSFGSTGRVYDLLFESDLLAKEAIKKGIDARIIVGSKFKNHEYIDKYPNLKVKSLDIESEATTSIIADKIAIHLIRDKPFIIIIKNKHIAESYRNYFEVLWKSAKD